MVFPEKRVEKILDEGSINNQDMRKVFNQLHKDGHEIRIATEKGFTFVLRREGNKLSVLYGADIKVPQNANMVVLPEYYQLNAKLQTIAGNQDLTARHFTKAIEDYKRRQKP